MKRKYKSELNLIVQGIEACRNNAERLVAAAKDELATERWGLALSLATLALEEIGKLLFVDGLLFSRAGDYKDESLRKGFRKHTRKLSSLLRFPLAVDAFARLDPRYTAELPYRQAIALSLHNWNQARHALAPWIGEACALDSLDAWKQRGFYVELSGERFMDPNETVPQEFARNVVLVAHHTVDIIGFIFKDNLDRYREMAARIRERRSEEDHLQLQQVAEELVEDWLGGLLEEEAPDARTRE